MIIDFSNYKFRASGVKNLMVKSRTKKDPLSKTTKSYLQEIYIEEFYGRKKPVSTPQMMKGTIVESDSLDLVKNVADITFFKNQKTLENDFVTGTPDVIDEKRIIDIKSSWDLWTFTKVDGIQAQKDYYYQLLSYMWLSGKDNSSLMYVLVDTPEMFITDELYRLSFRMPEEEAEKYRVNYEFSDIPEKKRMKQYDFSFSQDHVDEVKEKVLLAREYLNSLSL